MKSGKPAKKKKKTKHKHHRPVTEAKVVHQVKKNHELISKLHTLNKEKMKIQRGCFPELDKKQKLTDIDKKIQELGGLEVYQRASKTGECRHGNYNTAKWVIQQLKEKQLKPEHEECVQLLDVGALDLNYTAYKSWIKCTAIDLNPQKQPIIKTDFLHFQEDKHDLYDVVVLSLVINFVGDPVERGQMLKHACQLCKRGGHIFVILPLACLSNSRYMNHEKLVEMMTSLGCDLVISHNSPKLSFKMFQRRTSQVASRSFPKKQLRNGAKMNNFSIVIR